MSFFSRLFGTEKETARRAPAQIFITNTMSGEKERFMSAKPGLATLYSCGPTVYGAQHVGNLRAAVFSDTIARVLMDAGYHVRRVINITDVGHLVGDGEEGEDKMAVGAAREKKTPEEIADRYAKLYLDDIRALNLDTNHILFPRATEYIKEQVALAKTLEEKGFAYSTPDGLYFDVTRFPGYGKLGHREQVALEGGKRIDAHGKRNPADFALWRSAKPGDLQQWDSPWGRGNPGWHIECSVMSRALLGADIDIHTGGEDHISTHHNNEIAQSEAASGRPYVRYWMHNAFLTMNGEKISKSIGNVAYLGDVVERGIHPLALRYFFLQAHYRTPLSFSWSALEAAAGALTRLWRQSAEIARESNRRATPGDASERFVLHMRDDLGSPQALGLLWDALKNEDYSPEEKWDLLERADALLGLSLIEPPEETKTLTSEELPQAIQDLLKRREEARAARDFTSADALRDELLNSGYRVEDSPEGPLLTRVGR